MKERRDHEYIRSRIYRDVTFREFEDHFFIRPDSSGGGLYCPFDSHEERCKILDVLLICGARRENVDIIRREDGNRWVKL